MGVVDFDPDVCWQIFLIFFFELPPLPPQRRVELPPTHDKDAWEVLILTNILFFLVWASSSASSTAVDLHTHHRGALSFLPTHVNDAWELLILILLYPQKYLYILNFSFPQWSSTPTPTTEMRWASSPLVHYYLPTHVNDAWEVLILTLRIFI